LWSDTTKPSSSVRTVTTPLVSKGGIGLLVRTAVCPRAEIKAFSSQLTKYFHWRMDKNSDLDDTDSDDDGDL
jgi:hypothetical protein